MAILIVYLYMYASGQSISFPADAWLDMPPGGAYLTNQKAIIVMKGVSMRFDKFTLNRPGADLPG